MEERVEETMDEGMEASGASAAMKASTRGMQMHDLKQYEGFLTFLLSRQGGKKSEKNARGIVANVAKFHHYSSPESLNTEISLRAKAVRAFVAHLESMGLGPSGLTQKILDIEAHIKYLMCESEGSPEEGDVNVKGEATLKKLALLRRGFRGEKNRREREALEDFASDLPSLGPIKTFWESPEVTQAFLSSLESLRRTPAKEAYNRAAMILAGRLLFR